ncbi:MAG TPA: hypothetical protein DD635_08210 [Flavobacteriales bacterium]|nr:hypothetical protein [Flavobacteriales bacterium]|tara:strand:- start:618 stop:1487 length:870 start_codon:yes stop_codon:yes gene_type:complete
MKGYTRPVGLLVLAMIYIGLNEWGVAWSDAVLGSLLFLGLLAIGIPHGALDVWTHRHRSPGNSSILYIGLYLLAIATILFAWWSFPHIGMLVFLLLSAWHFGQADFERWEIPQGQLAWGMVALGMILVWHVKDINPIIGQMGVSYEVRDWLFQSQKELRLLFTASLIACGIMALRLKHWSWGLAIGLIGLTPWIPVLLSFGLYFIGQHSASGWHHLRQRLGLSSKVLWLKALPFTAGALALIALGMWVIGNPESVQSDATVGAFFMLLGCISIPHIFESHWFLISTSKY